MKEKQSCAMCGRYCYTERHHLIGGSRRQLSEKYGLVIDICRGCHIQAHEDPETYKKLHRYGEKMWLEKTGGTVEGFVLIFGKNYL